MRVPEIIEGLQIIQKSKPANRSDYHFRAERDEIFAGRLDWEMSDKDKKRMEELGWDADEDFDGWRASV